MFHFYGLISVGPISDKEKSYNRKERSRGNKNDKRNRKKEWMQNQIVSIKIPHLHKAMLITVFPIREFSAELLRCSIKNCQLVYLAVPHSFFIAVGKES